MTDGMLLREFLSEPDLASYRSAQVPQLPREGEPPTLASLRSAALLTFSTFLCHILSSLAFLSFFSTLFSHFQQPVWPLFFLLAYPPVRDSLWF